MKLDKYKSLQEIENDDWAESNFDSSLVARCHKLRLKPLNDFEVEDFRILIGQKMSLSILVPLAVW